MILQLFMGLGLAWLIYSLCCLIANVRRAHAMGIPVKVLPVSPMNILWVVSEPLVFAVIDRLPFTLGSLRRYGRRAWWYKDKATSHVELGNAFAIATPGEIFIHISDPDAIKDVFARRADFARPVEMYQMLAVYGPNLSTVGWTDWQRHRKAVAASFNEQTNKLAWVESLAQARDMLKSWTRCGESGARGTAQDTRTLSLDVLYATGFGTSNKFHPSNESSKHPNAARSYHNGLITVMDHAVFMMLVPPKLLSLPMIPKKWAHIGQATRDFRRYMTNTLHEERRLLDQGKPGTGSLMTSLLRASADHQKQGLDASRALTFNEILGDMFLINIAGHETTANALAYSVLLLAANPEVQNWVREELQTLLGDQEMETWDYEYLFPRLKRCQAVLLETVRLYPPIMALPRTTHHHSQALNVDGKTIMIPARSYVNLSLLAVHTHPEHWQPEPLSWQPSRWILSNASGRSHMSKAGELEREELYVPRPGTYFAWSDGPMNCPGKKFSQVEFVAVMACLLRDHRVRPLLQDGEDAESGRKRALAVCEDSLHILLVHMRDADSIRLVWEQAR